LVGRGQSRKGKWKAEERGEEEGQSFEDRHTADEKNTWRKIRKAAHW
jgi:hypothetical protein